MMLCLLIGLITLILFYYTCVKPFNYWKNRGVPQYHPLITLRESLLSFIPYRGIVEMTQKLYDDFPDSRYCGVYQFYQPTLALRDPDLIKQIAVKDFDHFVDHVQFLPDDSDPLWQNNLFALKGDKWRDMRATLSPSFTSSKMKLMFNLISDHVKLFVAYFEEQSGTISIEMKDTFTRFTNDIIATTAFGVNCDSMRYPNNEFYAMGKEVTNFGGFLLNIQMIITLLFPKIAKYLGLKLFSNRVHRFFTTLIKDNIKSREKNGIVRQDMIHLLMEAQKERLKDLDQELGDQKEEKREKHQISDVDITAQALIFFFAGFDSVATLMCFTAYELAVNPDIQDRLQNEIDETLQQCDGSVTYEALMKMKYMDMVISESLRKWPPGVIVDRVCAKPYTIEPVKEGETPVHLREGDTVWIPIFGVHRDPQHYFDPDRFDPERFSDENKADIPPYCYIPFGVGPRSCIGNRFALMETKLCLFYLLSKFHLTVTEKTKVPIKIQKSPIQLKSEGGFWLGLKRRHAQ